MQRASPIFEKQAGLTAELREIMVTGRIQPKADGFAALRCVGGMVAAISLMACHYPERPDLMDQEAGTIGPGKEQTFAFECEDGFRFTARTSGNAVWLFLPEHTVQLPRVRAESGSRYASAELSFWNEGEAALLETAPGSRRHCSNNRALALWEHAKLRGVDFRATGNEAGWHMEITLDGEIKLVTDYGQSTYRFKTPEPDIDQSARKTTYAVEDNQHRLVVELEGKPCRDSMSNQPFEVTVTVTLNEQQLHGCGRALH